MPHSEAHESHAMARASSMVGFFRTRRGFALPTVLIASIVMLAILVTGLVSGVAASTALRTQGYQRLADLASESGAEMARACLNSNYQRVTWTTSKPLTPATNCNGDVVGGQSAYVVDANGIRTTFQVPPPETAAGVYTIVTNGTLERVRSSNGQTWRAQKSVARMKVATPLLVSLDGGFDHSVGLSANRSTVFAWGGNNYGQLGTGSTELIAAPKIVLDKSDLDGSYIKQVIGGGYHTLVLTDNGNVYAGGLNAQCQLGVGDTVNRLKPTLVATAGTPMEGKRIVSIGAGKYHSLAVDDQGVAYGWGENGVGQLGDGSYTRRCNPVAVAAAGTPMAGKSIDIIKSNSNSHTTVALDKTEGRAYIWGDNSAGKLAIGNGTISNVNVPNAVLTAGTPMAGLGVGDIESETHATFFLSTTNRIFVAGGNFAGQWGNAAASTSSNASAVVEVPTAGTPLAGKDIIQISGDGHHGVALDSNGIVYSWGWNLVGQVGVGSANIFECGASSESCVRPLRAVVTAGTPMAGRKITSISTGDRWTYAVASDGTAYSWGHNSAGQLGIGFTQEIVSLPAQMVFPNAVLRY